MFLISNLCYRGANIRLIQAAIISRIVNREKEVIEGRTGGEVAIVFGGDFNSVAEAAAIRYLFGETIQPNDIG